MDSPWFVAWFILAVYAVIQSALLLVQADQHRYFARKRLAQNFPFRSSRRVALFVPCKGLDLELRQNLRPLFEQDYGDYEITFILDDAADPAGETIRRLMAEYPDVKSKIVVSGRAVDTGQKVHNLRHATANLAPGVDVLAFVDSDARPRSDWLRRLTCRLERHEVGAVTGYRWLIPIGGGWASRLLASINAAVAAMMGRGGHHLVWGGSWAIRREVFEQISLREAWRGTLSDDLVASRVVRGAGYKIEFEPCCMLASPVAVSGRQTVGFLRRQYLMGRFYARPWWMAAILGSSLATLGFWSSMVVAAIGAATQAEWAWLPYWMCGALLSVNATRAFAQYRLAKIYCKHQQVPVTPWADLWTWPITGLANWLGLAGSMFGSRLTWRGIRYTLSHAKPLAVEQPTRTPEQHLDKAAPRELTLSSGTNQSTGVRKPLSSPSTAVRPR